MAQRYCATMLRRVECAGDRGLRRLKDWLDLVLAIDILR